MYSKTDLYNLTLAALLLQKKIVNADTDTSVERNVLETQWMGALTSTLEDLDLDSTSEIKTLELITADPNDTWSYAYKYPSNCAVLRRIESGALRDTEDTHIKKRVGIYEGEKAIFTNQPDATIEYISNDFDLSILSSNAGLAVAHKLAWLSAPLIVGKNVSNLRSTLMEQYKFFKQEAQRHDALENLTFSDPLEESSFATARTS